MKIKGGWAAVILVFFVFVGIGFFFMQQKGKQNEEILPVVQEILEIKKVHDWFVKLLGSPPKEKDFWLATSSRIANVIARNRGVFLLWEKALTASRVSYEDAVAASDGVKKIVEFKKPFPRCRVYLVEEYIAWKWQEAKLKREKRGEIYITKEIPAKWVQVQYRRSRLHQSERVPLVLKWETVPWRETFAQYLKKGARLEVQEGVAGVIVQLEKPKRWRMRLFLRPVSKGGRSYWVVDRLANRHANEDIEIINDDVFVPPYSLDLLTPATIRERAKMWLSTWMKHTSTSFTAQPYNTGALDVFTRVCLCRWQDKVCYKKCIKAMGWDYYAWIQGLQFHLVYYLQKLGIKDLDVLADPRLFASLREKVAKYEYLFRQNFQLIDSTTRQVLLPLNYPRPYLLSSYWWIRFGGEWKAPWGGVYEYKKSGWLVFPSPPEKANKIVSALQRAGLRVKTKDGKVWVFLTN